MIAETAGEQPVGLSGEQREHLRRLLTDELRTAVADGGISAALLATLDERRRALEALRQAGDDAPIAGCGDPVEDGGQ
jgi:hypothetical protein